MEREDEIEDRQRKADAKLRSVLRKWAGQPAQVWDLSSSHPTLSIVVGDPQSPKYLVIYCLMPHFFEGPAVWKASEFEFSDTSRRNELGYYERLLSDTRNGFKVICDVIDFNVSAKLHGRQPDVIERLRELSP